MKIPLGQYHHFTTVDSTNTLAVAMAQQGAEHGTLIHADCQTGGKGRGGRKFLSPVGGLYFSLILRPEIELSALPLITLAVGVGLSNGIRRATGVQVQLKWPNDLYVDNKKLAGILTESGPIRKGGRTEYIIVGVGLNCTSEPELFPSELRGKIIALAEVTAVDLDVVALLPPLVEELLASVQRLSRGNKAALLAEWRNLDYLLGRPLDYVSQDNILSAIGAGLTDDGRYILLDQQGIQHQVTAGELSPIRATS